MNRFSNMLPPFRVASEPRANGTTPASFDAPEGAESGQSVAAALSVGSEDHVLSVEHETGWASGAAPAIDDDGDPVHDVLKKTDVWFAYRAGELEKEARHLAALHAEKGQPRHDLQRDGPLEMEILLERHGSEVLWGWMDRVRRKIQGAIGAETERIGTGVASARRAVANAEAARASFQAEQREAADAVLAFRVVSDGPAGPAGDDGEVVTCHRHVNSAMFLVLSALLILADFLANVPVFVELFPGNGRLAAALANWEAQQLSNGFSFSFGLKHLFARVTAYPEPSLLALSVIVFFLVLGHHFGTLVRTMVALWSHRHRSVSRAGAARWRQSSWPAIASLAGIVVVVVVLYVARAQVEPMAKTRYDAAAQQLTAAQEQLDAARSDATADIGSLVQTKNRAQSEVAARRERLEYAETLHGMNWPITLLNIVLVIAAMVLGYLHTEERFVVSPEAVSDRADRLRKRREEVRARLNQLWMELVGKRAEAHEALRGVEISIHRVDNLLEADVLRDWTGKAERIRRAIPLFRTENARLRGLDVEDILAFRAPAHVRLPTADEYPMQLDRPTALADYRAEFATLQARLHGLDGELLPPQEFAPLTDLE